MPDDQTPTFFEPRPMPAALEAERAEYVVIGGLAAALAGAAHVTFDLDITPNRSVENLERVAAAFRRMNARFDDVTIFVASLADVIRSKQAADRPRDRAVLPHLRRVLNQQPVARGLTVLPTDVFLVSYPRSGSTWLRFLLANALRPERRGDLAGVGGFVLLRYEDMLRAPREALDAALDLLGVEVDDATRAQAVARSEAGELRRLERETATTLPTFRGSGLEDPFIRKARAGTAVEELTPELRAQIADAWPEAAARVGYGDSR